MNIKLSKKYRKKIVKYSKKIQIKAWEAIVKFKNREHDKQLNFHRLSWEMKKYYTINVTWDIRILIDKKTWEVVEILDIWNHNHFYF